MLGTIITYVSVRIRPRAAPLNRADRGDAPVGPGRGLPAVHPHQTNRLVLVARADRSRRCRHARRHKASRRSGWARVLLFVGVIMAGPMIALVGAKVFLAAPSFFNRFGLEGRLAGRQLRAQPAAHRNHVQRPADRCLPRHARLGRRHEREGLRGRRDQQAVQRPTTSSRATAEPSTPTWSRGSSRPPTTSKRSCRSAASRSPSTETRPSSSPGTSRRSGRSPGSTPSRARSTTSSRERSPSSTRTGRPPSARRSWSRTAPGRAFHSRSLRS